VIAAAATGFGTGFSLILAIGAQNAFVLRQGLARRHVFAVCAICALSDAVLIAVGVGGFGAIATAAPWLPDAMRYGGAAFLIWYGATRLLAARESHVMQAAPRAEAALGAAIVTALAFTWLNPHVYLDTLALLGAIGAGYAGAARLAFGIGAAIASFVFFFGLGYGARLIAPVMARPKAWVWLDAGIGVVMWMIAAQLLLMKGT
jgi:L-lysine exporter family protein LysE/ArgO